MFISAFTSIAFKHDSTSLVNDLLSHDTKRPHLVEFKQKAGEHMARLFSEKHLGEDIAQRNYKVFCNIWKIPKDQGTVHSIYDALDNKIKQRTDRTVARTPRFGTTAEELDHAVPTPGSASSGYDASGSSGDLISFGFDSLDGVC